jgi:hypothetical protein
VTSMKGGPAASLFSCPTSTREDADMLQYRAIVCSTATGFHQMGGASCNDAFICGVLPLSSRSFAMTSARSFLRVDIGVGSTGTNSPVKVY